MADELRPIGTEFEITNLIGLSTTCPEVVTTRYRIIKHSRSARYRDDKVGKPSEVVEVVEVNERAATLAEILEGLNRRL